MKVGIDVSQAIYGTGVSHYVINLVSHLPSNNLTLVGFSLRRRSEIHKLFPQSTTYPIPPTALHYLWNRMHVLNFENFAPGNIDVYHSSDWAQAPDSSAKVTTIHDLSPLIYPHEHHPKIVNSQQARLHWVSRECNAIICVSQNTANDLTKLFPGTKDRIHVIPEALPAHATLKPLKSPFSDYIVTVGARQPRKNIAKLVSAYIKYRSKLRLPEKLIIVGENSAESPHPSVVYTGFVPDQLFVSLLAGADCFVYPSLYEGFGLPILEAFYHNVPVACSNTSSFPEVAGIAASFFDPQSEEAIAQAIALAIKHRHKHVLAGQKQLSKFSWAKAADQTLAVYKSLC